MFVPTIKKSQQYYNYFKYKYQCDMICSETSNKNEIIKNFSDKKILFLITTTLLERGVTFENIDVLVCESDHLVYTKDTLIQIAGRVGRNVQDSEGKVVFMSKFKSQAMIDAKKEIIEMNGIKEDAV